MGQEAPILHLILTLIFPQPLRNPSLPALTYQFPYQVFLRLLTRMSALC